MANATASPSTVVVGQTVSFDGSESEDEDTKVWKEWDDKEKKYIYKRKLISGEVKTWSWNFGDGGSGSGATTTHKYTQLGEYTVKLTITCDHDETASTTVKVTVTPITLKVTPDSTWVYAGGEKEFTVIGYDKDGKEVELDSSKVGWSTTAGEMNPSSGQTTSTLTARETPLEEGTVTATYPGATAGKASVRVWPEIGELRITGPAYGKSGQPRTYTAHVWDTYGGSWGGFWISCIELQMVGMWQCHMD